MQIDLSVWRWAVNPQKIGLKKLLKGPDGAQLLNQVKSFMALPFGNMGC